MKNVICLPRSFSNILEMIGRMLTGQWLSFDPLNPFLKIGVIFASFKISNIVPLLRFLMAVILG